MRMRHKKNLEQRIQNSSDYLLVMHNESKNFNDAKNENHTLDFAEFFNNSNPVYLEIGCGKGQFACTWATQNPNKNILCVEKDRNVIITAVEKAREANLKNIKFLGGAAEYLPSYIESKSIEDIFLNFSCPFPKKKYEAHRLTYKRFLDIYKIILKDKGAIYQKTDNMHFFEYSIESFSQNGFKLSEISLDLHSSDFENNIQTEYENKFVSLGLPIYRLKATL